jgi:hypothetical protein
VELVISNDKYVLAKLRAAPEIVAQEVYKFMVEASILLEATAKEFSLRTTVPKPGEHQPRTGALTKAIQGKVHRYTKEWQVTLEVSQSVPYAPFVEYGTGVLGRYHQAFIGHAIGNYPNQRVPPRATRVSTYYIHPGMHPRPYIRPAIDQNRNIIGFKFEQMGHRIAEKIG